MPVEGQGSRVKVRGVQSRPKPWSWSRGGDTLSLSPTLPKAEIRTYTPPKKLNAMKAQVRSGLSGAVLYGTALILALFAAFLAPFRSAGNCEGSVTNAGGGSLSCGSPCTLGCDVTQIQTPQGTATLCKCTSDTQWDGCCSIALVAGIGLPYGDCGTTDCPTPGTCTATYVKRGDNPDVYDATADCE
jgi:hypothetical protein